MNKSKKLLLIAVVVILVIAIIAVALTYVIPKLNAGKVVKDINGKTPEEAFQLAIQHLETISRYEYTASVDVKSKILGITLFHVEADPLLTYSYDGDNRYGIVYKEGLQEMEENDMWDDIGYDEFWYVDGYTYVLDGNSKIKYHGEYVESSSEYEREVAYLLRTNEGEVTCYQKGDGYYFTIETTGSDEEYEEYTVYLTADGFIEKIVVTTEYSEDGIKATSLLTVNYRYDNLDPITVPADADSYH